MDRIERIEHPQESLMIALEGMQTNLWTTLPGIIQTFDPLTMTVTVQPSIQAELTNKETGTKTWTSMPLLVDVPIIIQSSGGMSITLPIAKNDECLVCFSNRCIDAWWQLGGVQIQPEFRMHDLSDGFAFIGPRSLPRIISNYSTTSMQIRSDDGVAIVDINPVTHAINVTTTAAINITTTGTATVKAASILLQNAGSTLKKLMNDTVIALFNNHVHTNGNGGANTGVPTVAATAANATSIVQAE